MSTPGTGTQPPQASPALLHRFLGIGLIITSVALGIARSLGSGGLAPDPDPLVSYILSGISAVMALVALMFLKRRIPGRRSGQMAAQYWADQKNVGPAMVFWFILEGAGIIASIAYFLEGSPIPAALAAFVIALFWMNGPRVFDKE